MTQTNSDVSSHRYTINLERVFSERLENETIVIDLNTGIYYSLNSSGSVVWEAINQGLTSKDIASVIAGKFESPAQEQLNSLVLDIKSFIEKLQTFSLISLKDTQISTPSINFDFDISEITYQPPSIEAHDDVKDLLLADIVHSVDRDGWPNIPS